MTFLLFYLLTRWKQKGTLYLRVIDKYDAKNRSPWYFSLDNSITRPSFENWTLFFYQKFNIWKVTCGGRAGIENVKVGHFSDIINFSFYSGNILLATVDTCSKKHVQSFERQSGNIKSSIKTY